MIAVVCMKWGTAFGPDYVNVLYRAVTRHLQQPFRFYCFTDDGTGLLPEVLVRPIPNLKLSPKRIRHGCWPKIGLFQPGLIAEEVALFLDLDMVITGSLDDFVERKRKIGGLHIIREWNPGIWNLLPLALRPDRGSQSSVVCWTPSEQHGIYRSLVDRPEEVFFLSPNDQQHINRNAGGKHYWPQGWTASFKRDCVWHYPLNLLFAPSPPTAATRIVVFHGRPRPHQLIEPGRTRWGTATRFGFGPVGWVRSYWSKGLGENIGHGVVVEAVAKPAAAPTSSFERALTDGVAEVPLPPARPDMTQAAGM